MIITIEQYKEQLSESLDPDEAVDVLNISTDELLEAFPCKVLKNFEREFDTMEPTSEDDV
jgi:hypothetical protein